MHTHELKSWSYLFKEIASGNKTFEFRDTRDRTFKVGEVVRLLEFDQTEGEYTGELVDYLIMYITDRMHPCALSSIALMPGFCIIGFELI